MLGIHQKFENPMSEIISTAQFLGADTFQIFTRNNRNGLRRDITIREIDDFNKAFEAQNAIRTWVVHACYVMNPSSLDDAAMKRAVELYESDMKMLEQLYGRILYVIHPGSSEQSPGSAHRQLYMFLQKVRSSTPPNVEVCLETMSGSTGNTKRFASMHEAYMFMKLYRDLDYVGLCFDTAHVFQAGEDPTWAWKELKPYVKVVHLNNSKTPMGSKWDQHESIRSGQIPTDQLVALAKDVPADVPIILETPQESLVDDYRFLKERL